MAQASRRLNLKILSAQYKSVEPSGQNKSTPGARWVCKGPGAPTDLVVVKEGFVSLCPRSDQSKDETNAWFNETPADKEIMCKGFIRWGGREIAGAPIPIGYVVTGEAESAVCSKSSETESSRNAWMIRKPTGNDTVCKGFPLPRGFVMVSEVVNSQCPAKPEGKNAWLIRPK